MKKNVFIIGLGRFGQRLALYLRDSGCEVTVSDINKDIVKSFSVANNFGNEMILNSTNIEVLKSTGISNADHVVVAISKIEDSILTCVNLKDIGIKNITAKAANKTHSRILKSIGINDVIFPEEEAALSTAQKITNTDMDIIRKGSSTSVIRLRITNGEINGQTTNELNQSDFRIFAVLKNEAGSVINMNPDNVPLRKMDTIFVITANDRIKWIRKTFIDEPKHIFGPKKNISTEGAPVTEAAKKNYGAKEWMKDLRFKKETKKKKSKKTSTKSK